MTVEREQAWKCEGCRWTNVGFVGKCDGCGESQDTAIKSRFALLAELDQAERERDEWMTPFDGDAIAWHESLPSPYTYKAADFGALLAAVHSYECRALDAEARLAAVPALVEAIATALTSLATGPAKDGYAYHVLDEALTAYRQATTA